MEDEVNVPVPAAPETPGSTAPVDDGTPAAPTDPKPAADDGKPEPTGDEPDTTGKDAPKEGDEPENPDAADKAPETDPETPDKPEGEEENQNETTDLKSMSRAERAQYFQNLESSTRREIETQVNEVYQPQSHEELKQKYLEEGHSEFEASVLAREEVRDQENDIAKARAERAELNVSLATEAMEVLANLDWLNPSKKDSFDKESSDAATQLYDELCLSRDENTVEHDAQGNAIPGTGQIIGATMTPKQFYGLIDTIRSAGTDTARQAAQKAAEEQMAAVAPPSSNTTNRDKAFDQLSTSEKRAKLLAEGHLIT